MNHSSLKIALCVTLALSFTSFAKSKKSKKPMLSPNAESMLKIAIETSDEAKALYASSSKKFGKKSPFSKLLKNEKKTSKTLESIAKKYKVSLNKDANYAPPHYEELSSACGNAVMFERNRIKFIERNLELKPKEDIKTTFRGLRDFSKKESLPALKACAPKVEKTKTKATVEKATQKSMKAKKAAPSAKK